MAGKINPSKINVKKPGFAMGNRFTTASETKDDILRLFLGKKDFSERDMNNMFGIWIYISNGPSLLLKTRAVFL